MISSEQRKIINQQNANNTQDVRPIKNKKDLDTVKDTLLNNFKFGRRNYTIFQLGKATLLRVSDVLNLKYLDVFDEDGNVRSHARIRDVKTGKRNAPLIKKAETDLLAYQSWFRQQNYVITSNTWLFPSSRDEFKPVSTKQFYHIMKKVSDLTGIEHLGTHTMRKTGAYMVYKQSNYNIGLVSRLLNHSSESATLYYLGLDRESIDSALMNINFD